MSRNVLVVDDSASVRTLVRGALERAGYAVTEACDGEDARERLDGVPMGLIVFDLAMPRMDGMAFLQWIRNHPRYRYTPAVVLSTETRESVKEQARVEGAQAFVHKPFTPSQLVSAVQRLCQ